MDFTLNVQGNITHIARQIGYVIIDTQDGGKHNLVRKLGHDHYPRFHAYVTQKGRELDISLHLDQNAPVYKGSSAHQGEYWGPAVEDEALRIKQLLGA